MRVRRGRWGRGGCWRSSDLKRRETANQSAGITTFIRLEQSAAGVCYLCPGWWTKETAAAVVVAWLACLYPPEACVCPRASCVCACAAPPAPWRGGCDHESEPRRAAGVPANQGSPELNCSSHTGALLPSGGPEHTPTSETHNTLKTRQDSTTTGNHGQPFRHVFRLERQGSLKSLLHS